MYAGCKAKSEYLYALLAASYPPKSPTEVFRQVASKIGNRHPWRMQDLTNTQGCALRKIEHGLEYSVQKYKLILPPFKTVKHSHNKDLKNEFS